jgi:Ni/Fe-hydrogenase subunit HybB-like protein
MTTPEAKKERRLPVGTMILALLVVIFLGVAVNRFANGLGAVSNMSDGRAWGLWIPFDLFCGVPLAAGGFTMAAIVYIFNNKKYLPLARPAILTAFIGYLLVVFALLVDLGQPWHIFRMIWNPNIHSPLYEVGWCVMLYNVVLALEFAPAIFEKLRELHLPAPTWKIPLRTLHMIEIPLIIAGIVISTGHQNSLGSMLLLMGNDLNQLWYTPILPLLFFLHAVCVGPAMVIIEATVSSKVFGHKLDISIFSGLGKILCIPLVIYLLFKVGDVIVAGEVGTLFSGFPANAWWWAEMIIGVVLPLIMFLLPVVQKSRGWLFVSALLVVLGLILNRFNVTLMNLEMRPGYGTYFPTWMEIAVSVGLFSGGMIVIMLANKFLPVMKHDEGHGESHEEKPAEAPASA